MTCPNCGYCQHCGRGRYMAPSYPVPYYPVPYWPATPAWPPTPWLSPTGTGAGIQMYTYTVSNTGGNA